jgi:hypothetical protein
MSLILLGSGKNRIYTSGENAIFPSVLCSRGENHFMRNHAFLSLDAQFLINLPVLLSKLEFMHPIISIIIIDMKY